MRHPKGIFESGSSVRQGARAMDESDANREYELEQRRMIDAIAGTTTEDGEYPVSKRAKARMLTASVMWPEISLVQKTQIMAEMVDLCLDPEVPARTRMGIFKAIQTSSVHNRNHVAQLANLAEDEKQGGNMSVQLNVLANTPSEQINEVLAKMIAGEPVESCHPHVSDAENRSL